MMEVLGRWLVLVGLAIAGAGLLMWALAKLPFISSLGGLPGDLVIRRGPLTVFLPLGTMILISVLLTLVLNVLFRVLRR
jgi:hypothetical protein